ncbi:MAG: selenocysteine-specific translation elongation factor [Peptococcaceae bacterium]|nr:selenocysteine-specific translation elongation factor [Peptococcaceae bacterium]
MKHLIIGTAGHVDHGKTALVKALTGVDTDRLKEEKERGISIELGFTYLDLPGRPKVGIVDVPGHERFIKNMLAGAGGFDLVLFVIAADEGVMPQTREHLDIIQLLQVKKGIVVLTKIDMVEEDWLELVQEEVSEFLLGTIFETAPMVAVSAVTGAGIDQLLQLLALVLEETPPKAMGGAPRMPVDRVFSVTGFGTVVTGTMVAGEMRVGDAVVLQPKGLSTRVRSLQSHGEKVESVGAGQRVAANLAGLEVEQISRGSVVAGPDSLIPTRELDVRLLLLKDAPRSLKNRAPVRFYLGSGEILGRIRLLDRDELLPGDIALVQLELEEKTVAQKGDRFVLRSYSPMQTIGGGTIIDPAPGRKHKRFHEQTILALETREKGSPGEILEQYLHNRNMPGLPELAEIAVKTAMPVMDVHRTALDLAGEEKVKVIDGDGKTYILLGSAYRRLADGLQLDLAAYHQEYPLREGYPKEELRSRKFPEINNKVFQILLNALEQDQMLRCSSQAVSNYDFAAGTGYAELINRVRHEMNEAGFQPPPWQELALTTGINEQTSAELLQYLLRKGEFVKIGDNIFYLDDTFEQIRGLVNDYLHKNGEITVRDLRDILQASRKYALPILEYFDKEKITQRVGDKRLPGRNFSAKV